MQLTIANWRVAVEHMPTKLNSVKKSVVSKLEREVNRARMMQQVENERLASQNRMMLAGGRLQF